MQWNGMGWALLLSVMGTFLAPIGGAVLANGVGANDRTNAS